MAFVSYTGLRTADEVLEKMSEYVKSRGFAVITDCVEDTNVFDKSTYDGKRLVFTTHDGKYFVNMRSANGINIFGSAYDAIMDQRPRESGTNYQGIGLVVSEGQVFQTRWYNQYHVPLSTKESDPEISVQAVFMPLKQDPEPIAPNPPEPVDEPIAPNPPELDLPDEPEEPQKPPIPNISRCRKFSEINEPVIDTYFLAENDDNKIYYTPDLYYEDSWIHHYGSDFVVVFTSNGYTHSGNYSNQDTLNNPARFGAYDIKWPDKLMYNNEEINSLQDILDIAEKNNIKYFGRNDVLSSLSGTLDEQLIYFTRAGSSSNIGGYRYYIMSNEAFEYFKNLSFEEQIKKYDDDMTQYKQDFETWRTDHQLWQNEVNNLMNKYQEELKYYNTKLNEYNKLLDLYKQYLLDYDKYLLEYDKYLENHKIWEDNICDYTLYCNHIFDTEDILWFSLVKQDTKKLGFWQTAHLGVGYVHKYSNFEGGIWFTGSANGPQMSDRASLCFEDTVDCDKYILPVLSSGIISNTFFRMDIDDAPSYERGEIIWASSGLFNETGKKLSLPIRNIHILNKDNTLQTYSLNQTNGQIPHYYGLQSKTRTDWGTDINTLNGITVNMPIFFSVLLDPDYANEYSAVGFLDGIYFCCNLNMQTSHIYNIFYPTEGNIYQVFPARGKRRGISGFDAISIRQRDETDIDEEG